MSEVAYADFGSPVGNYITCHFTQELYSTNKSWACSQFQLGSILANRTLVGTPLHPTSLITLSNPTGTSVAGATHLAQTAAFASTLEEHVRAKAILAVSAPRPLLCTAPRGAWGARHRPPSGIAETCLPDTACRKFTFPPQNNSLIQI